MERQARTERRLRRVYLVTIVIGMFTWICPKCGKEVPPAYSECPNCAVKAADAPASEPAATPTPPAPAAPPAAAPAPPSRTANVLFAVLAAAAFVVIGLTAVILLRPNRTTPAPAPKPPATAALENPPSASAAAANPAYRDLELTGFRIVEDARKRPQLRFIAVNHSNADLGEIKAQAILRASNVSPKEPPVATFAFTTNLGPYESHDVTAPLETSLRAYELPDWQLIRADIVGQ